MWEPGPGDVVKIEIEGVIDRYVCHSKSNRPPFYKWMAVDYHPGGHNQNTKYSMKPSIFDDYKLVFKG